jgi:hypothetical protein
MADPCDGHPHEDLTGARRVENDLADVPVLADPAQHGGTTLHGNLPGGARAYWGA